MKLAYGTYAMPTVPLEEAIPGLARIGYEGIEICLGPNHVGAELTDFDPGRRASLRALLAEHHLGVPALFMLGSIYTPDAQAHQDNLARVRQAVQLARDLGVDEPPVIAIGFGARQDQWDEVREPLAALLRDYGSLADELDFTLAGEAHAGAAVNCSDRIIWLLDRVGHPRVRLHFDIVHLFLSGEPISQSVLRLLPYTAHTHVTDAIRKPDGGFTLVLPGTGDLDLVEYVGAMKRFGWEDFITLEISTMVWSQPDYDVWGAAQHCYDAMTAAATKAGA